MSTLHFVEVLEFSSADALGRQRLERVAKLMTGGAATDLAQRLKAQEWRFESGEALVAIESVEAVLFAAASDVVLDYTIQSSFELDHALTEVEWAHHCRGAECWICTWCD